MKKYKVKPEAFERIYGEEADIDYIEKCQTNGIPAEDIERLACEFGSEVYDLLEEVGTDKQPEERCYLDINTMMTWTYEEVKWAWREFCDPEDGSFEDYLDTQLAIGKDRADGFRDGLIEI